MSEKINCCQECQERHPGCHSKCQEYLKQKLKKDLKKKAREAEKEKECVFMEYIVSKKKG